MWVWVVGCTGLALFLYFRAHTLTEEDAKLLASQEPGFGPKISLWVAVRMYFGHGISWCLLVGAIGAWSWRVWLGNFGEWDVITVALIVGSWPFQEWAVHAWLLHLKPLKIGQRQFEPVVARTHRIHHQDPWKPEFGLTTPHIIVGYLIGLPLVASLFMPLTLAATTTAMTVTMILNYEWVHYLIHTSYQPKTKLYRHMWRHHRLHHFKNEDFWFGLTMTAGDSLLGTNPNRDEAPNSPTCMTLGIDQDRQKWTQSAASKA